MTLDWRHFHRAFDSLPPHAVEAEMALLGSILVDPSCLQVARSIVPGKDWFYKPANGIVYEHMLKVAKNNVIDLVMLNQSIVDAKALDWIGGLDYLVCLASAVPNAANAKHYAQLVAHKHRVRQMLCHCGDALYRFTHEPERYIDTAYDLLKAINNQLPWHQQLKMERAHKQRQTA